MLVTALPLESPFISGKGSGNCPPPMKEKQQTEINRRKIAKETNLRKIKSSKKTFKY
ncbi:hypothetical protein LPTSP3_g15090 [Leptospira kobayashii]|uniref:Uncharacterized protein n=1 Tax=Leptospira kobayashii TaxID=1917830 RepID=A0ABN6KE27_9LEPT|nr:hypothetical protein LPTSP3_g15090 [Leptospira kobayashii]